MTRRRRSARSRTPSSTSQSTPRRSNHDTPTRLTRRRVVITGLGMISPLGVGNDATWQGLIDGKSGMGRITKFDASAYACQIAGEVHGFNAEQWLEKKE